MERLKLDVNYLVPAKHTVVDAWGAEVVIILGGPISANDVNRFPYLEGELEMIRYRLKNKLPTLGICLGAQLIVKAMGAKVYSMTKPEIGWAPLKLTDAGRRGPLKNLESPVLHWHGETFELPDGCETLASTPHCKNQAFAVGDHTLGLQFHIEVHNGHLENWLLGHIHGLDHNGIDVPSLRERWSALRQEYNHRRSVTDG